MLLINLYQDKVNLEATKYKTSLLMKPKKIATIKEGRIVGLESSYAINPKAKFISLSSSC
jgi:hypothetical protein